MEVKFRVDTGFAGCVHEVTEEVDDDMTDSELEEYAQELAWEYINVSYSKISE